MSRAGFHETVAFGGVRGASKLPLVLLFSPAVVLGFTPLFARVIK
jgi:hypothetical protein